MNITETKNINAIAIFIIIATFGLLWFLMPYYIDDLWYLEGTFGITDRFQRFTIAANNAISHWFYDTGRVVNLISPIFLTLVPKWLFAIFCMFMLWVIIRYACKLSGAKPASFQQWLIIVAISFIIPWNDNMFCEIFTLNYILPSALMLVVVHRTLRMNESEFTPSKKYVIVTFIAAFLCGWSHEGFSVPLIIGLSAYVLTIGLRNTNRKVIWSCIAIFLGIITLLSGPAISVRSDGFENIIERMTRLGDGGWLWRLIIYNILYYIHTFVLAISLCNKNIRRELLADNRRHLAFSLMILSAGTVCFGLFFRFYTGPRCGLCAELLSAIGLVYLFSIWQKHMHFTIKPMYTIALATLATSATIYINCSAAVLQTKLNKEFDEVVRLYLASGTGEIYYDVMPYKQSYIKSRSSLRQFSDPWCTHRYSAYYNTPNKPLSIRPAAERPQE
jgi:hypothetical protein